MDPHSRLSQFNQRPPKSGPESRSFHQTPRLLQDRPTKCKNPGLNSDRPIATNSRIKRDEKYRNDMHLVYVNNALQQKSNGVNGPFEDLVSQFKPQKGDTPEAFNTLQIRDWLLALSHVVSRLERQHFALVEAIVHMPWTTMDNATVKSYTVFVGMLLSARPEYLSIVLDQIAQALTYQAGSQALNADYAESSSSPITRRIVYDRVHTLLAHIISLIPTCPSALYPLLVRHFPHKRQSQSSHQTYIRNLLRVSQYCRELSSKLLSTIVDRALQIDVEIQTELEELEDHENQTEEVFELDPFDTIVGQDDENSDDEDDEDTGDNFSDISSAAGDMDDEANVIELTASVQHIQNMVQKLDDVLTLIFEHLDSPSVDVQQPLSEPSTPLPPLPPDDTLSRSSSPLTPGPLDIPLTNILDRPPIPESKKDSQRMQFHALLAIFDRSILRTFKSRYTQFLLFYYSSLDTEFADIFQGMLVSKALLEIELPAVTRAAAASYIGSFVSRANYVDQDATRRVVNILCEFLTGHLDAFECSNGKGVGMAQNTVFYAVTQAVFLIFCFRWRDLQEDGEQEVNDLSGHLSSSKMWMAGLGIMHRLISSALNPLKICSPNVVAQFARVAHATDFVYCYTVLESNRRTDSSSSSNRHTIVFPAAVASSDLTELNTFFPFDPYKLPRSNRFIENIFREWSSVAIGDGDEDEDDEDEDDDEDEPVMSTSGSFSQRLAINKKQKQDEGTVLSASLNAMSISPAPSALVKAF